MMLDTIKLTLQPASITMMLALLACGLVLLYARPRWGRRWFAFVLLGYWVLASPIGAGLLARSLSAGYAPLQAIAEAQGATAVVVLGGGNFNIRAGGFGLTYVSRGSGLRAIEAARVYRLLGDPLVIVSGGVTDKTPGAAPESEAFRVAMLALGVPASRVVLESESRNTHDEAVVLKRMLGDLGVARFVLVTSPLHMRRSMAAFAAQGLYPVPSPAPLAGDRPRDPPPFVPNDASLEIGNAAVYEWCARAYYRARGWTR